MWMLAPHPTLPYATHLIHIRERVGPPSTSKGACTIGAHRHRGQTYTTLRPLHSTPPVAPRDACTIGAGPQVGPRLIHALGTYTA